MTGVIVALSGLAGSGKSTVADHLCARWGFRREKMAGPLKDMLRVLGLTDAHIEGALKEVPCDLLGGRTPREAMITLGTEWGRDLVHPDLWVNAWKRRAAGGLVVCDDCRFVNEAAAIRSMGGSIVRIVRAGQAAPSGHISETGQAAIRPDHILANDSDVPGLIGKVDRLMADLLGVDLPTAPI